MKSVHVLLHSLSLRNPLIVFRNYKLEVNNDIRSELWFSNGGAGMTGAAEVRI